MNRTANSYLLAVSLLVTLVSAACSVDLSNEDVDSNSASALSVDWTPPVADLYRQFTAPGDRYTNETEPVLAGRCVVCHECVEAPCQLKLSSYAGLRRGTSKEELLGSRLSALKPTRLKDERSLAAWRSRDYSPVVADNSELLSSDENAAQSILSQAIAHSREHNREGFDRGALSDYYASGEKECPATAEEHRSFLEKNSAAGMPLGFTTLANNDYSTLDGWVRDGAPGPSPAAETLRTTPSQPQAVAAWELFLNRPSREASLIARYLYEHVSELRFHLKESPGEFFELVRSTTKAPQAIDEIVTEKTIDSPGSTPFYYRLMKVNQVRSKKTHIVWNVGADEIERLRQTFESQPWKVPTNFKMTYTGNPFADFEHIPARARSQFMLEHAQIVIDQMVRGPVCFGRAATYAIRDHFWVSFLNPDSDPSVVSPYLGRTRQVKAPSGWATVGDPIPMDYSSYGTYQEAFEMSLRSIRPNGLGLDDIWDSNGNRDTNAMLTVFRHDSSATVHRGWIGGPAPTLWVISYSNFERLYYNLVAQYVPWGSALHKIGSWDYMHKVREESEHLFLSFLPPENRDQVEDSWYQGLSAWSPSHWDYFAGRPSRTHITNSNDPARDLANQIRSRTSKELLGAQIDEFHTSWGLADAVTPTFRPYAQVADFERALKSLTGRSDRRFLRYLPILSHLRVMDRERNKAQTYTLIANHEFADNESPLISNHAFRPERTTLSVLRGLEGGHSYLFFDVPLSQAHLFVRGLWETSSKDQWILTRDAFAVHRNRGTFWKTYDWFMASEYRTNPISGGLIDLNHYDRDETP